jgi:alginate O-acetyltransferase complex protein AlgI
VHFLSFQWVAWLLGTVAAYWVVPARFRDWVLIGVTLAFLVVHAPNSAAILVVFAVLTYFASLDGRFHGYRVLAAAGVIFAVLFYYKIRIVAEPEDLLREVFIPLGLSYYSFRCVHYLIERYRGGIGRHGLREFLAYLFFLPTIVVGPIHRAPAFLRDLHEKRWDGRNLAEGLERILYGYVKIAVLGNYLVSSEFAQVIGSIDATHTPLILYLDVVRTGLNLYLQFSGFADIAIGFALLLGYRIIENFNWPFLQRNIADFWRGWHISLTTWTRDYVYMPTLGLTRNPYAAAAASFVVIGLWHEISLRYLAWGLYNAFGIMAWTHWQRLKRRLGLPRVKHPYARRAVDVGCIFLTANFFLFSFVLVRQPDFASSLAIYRAIFLFWM